MVETTEEMIPGGGDGDVVDDHTNDIGPDAANITFDDDSFGYIDGELEVAGDNDVFQFTLDSGTTVDIDLFSWNGDLDTYVSIYDSDANLIADNDDAFGTDSSLTLNLEAGTYYVSADSSDKEGAGEYGLDIYQNVNFGDDGGFDDGGFDDGGFDDGGFDDGSWGDGFGDGDGDDGGFDDDWGDGGWDTGSDDGWGDDWSEPTDDGSPGFDDFGGDDFAIPMDVNGDKLVSAMDVLSIITFLNNGQFWRNEGAVDTYDVTDDGEVSPLDALTVITHLNQQAMNLGSQGNEVPADEEEPDMADIAMDDTSDENDFEPINDGDLLPMLGDDDELMDDDDLTIGDCPDGSSAMDDDFTGDIDDLMSDDIDWMDEVDDDSWMDTLVG